jgi:uncharacterized protein (TIGR02421 family)
MHDDSIRTAARQLREAESSVRVLRGIAWSRSVREEFFARGAVELPRVTYPSYDAAPAHAAVDAAVAQVHGDSAIARWLRRSAQAIRDSASLLAATATPAFATHGERLFGLPTSSQGGTTALALAENVVRIHADHSRVDLGAAPAACLLAEGLAEDIRRACAKLFGADAPEVLVVEELSANALAGPRRIQIRRDACFTDRDARQLIEHEAYVHVCTSLNGRRQTQLPLLAAAHAGTTRTQEGLAVFAEFITGSLELDRLRRLALRVLAIQMALEGADFLQVYRFFLERGIEPVQAYESSRRVFRGGVLTGGAPFTKDLVYLDGFLRVTNCLRAVFAEGRADCLPLLFCGKLDLDDLPAMAQLVQRGLCRLPTFLPPWAADRRFLVTYLAYSQFLGTVNLDAHREHYAALLDHAPRLAPPDASLPIPPEVL